MFSIVLDYGEHDLDIPKTTEDINPWMCRQDQFSTYRSGFAIRTCRLCRRILIFHHFLNELGKEDYLVKSMDFKYDQSPFTTYLTSITHVGYIWKDNKYSRKSFPPLELSYSQFPTDEQLYKTRSKEFDPSSLENLPQGVDGKTYRWLDLDGEGISGIFVEQSVAWFYKRNQGPATFNFC